MIMATKNDIFKEKLSAYLQSDKKQKGEILKNVCFVTGMHKKSAVRKFGNLRDYDPWKEGDKKRGPHETYGADVTVALKKVWEAGNEVCGELIHPVIEEYVTILKRDKMWKHTQDVTEKLLQMSEGTVKRRVGNFLKIRKKGKGISATRPAHIKYLVPIFTGPWKDKAPGHGQIDTVRHSNSAFGDCVFTLNYTDAATLMVIPRAQWNKGEFATRESMKQIKERFPFPWLGAHPDSGSEFINRMVIDWCKEEKIDYSRSRPNHKNDNMHVEERNGHVIRKFVRYVTLNCPDAVDALNDVYDVLYPYLLHFVAVRRQIKKERINSQYRRKYEKKAKTPYLRILEHAGVSEEDKVKLKNAHELLNPLTLKNEIDKRLKRLYDIQRSFGNSSEKF
ncbi:MAG: hypothetical protein COT31_04085 [Candidatus Moranbacteria bacterium CG08_land_8_20_14_0_20_34_16]|nr:MAG: hypothetical protein COT31_04085 [Candidatus Moranbacteria bacterium CG08_land_8_20_14_0_20_34_16]